MKAEKLIEIIGADFYTGVPDSQLKALCDSLMNLYGNDYKHHIIAANEGNCTAMAAGYYLATGKTPAVYLQNSGIGNVINPAASLLSDRVYAIPVLFIIGWRGEPGVHDEPQHIFQGEVTIKLLEDMGIETFIISRETVDEEAALAMQRFRKTFACGRSAAFVIRKGALEYTENTVYENDSHMMREEVIRRITAVSGEDPVISTTGKASRELFEIRTASGQPHKYDFLTVGSMGHCSSIALGVALSKTEQKIWCIDGDGAVLMHMGSLAVIGRMKPPGLIHIVINNGAHETVGGMPTVAGSISLAAVAKACGYPNTACVHTYEELEKELAAAKKRTELSFIEAECAIGARENLGRPTVLAWKNKQDFMGHLKNPDGIKKRL